MTSAKKSEKSSLAVTEGCEDSGRASPSPGVDESRAKRDLVIALGRTSDEKGVRVIRARDDRLEAGEVRPVEEGKPISGDLVQLTPRQNTPHVCDVETLVSAPQLPGARAPEGRASGHSGPAQVASEAYRRNWDSIWSTSSGEEEAPGAPLGANSPGSSKLN